MEALMGANLEKMKTCLENTESTLGWPQQMRVEIKTGEEEIKATVRASQESMEVNQDKLKAECRPIRKM
jgi:hypothetical protein